MKLQNPFSQETRLLYLYEYSCFTCGRSDRGLELHHIKSRISNSPLNSYLICNYCHSHANHSQKEEAQYLQTTMKWLLRQGYELTQKDIEFYAQHKKLYDMKI